MIFILLLLLLISIIINFALFVKAYSYEGDIRISRTESGKKMHSLDFDGNPEDIETMKVVRFRVIKEEVSYDVD